MLNINATKTDAVLDLVLEGRLDTVTAPQLQAAANEQLAGVDSIKIDCKDLA